MKITFKKESKKLADTSGRKAEGIGLLKLIRFAQIAISF